MEADIQAILEIIKSSTTGTLGALGAASALVYGLIKIIRLNLIQALLGRISPKAQWKSWPKVWCMVFVFSLTLVGSFLGALATGIGWLPALVGGIMAGLVAMGGDAAVSSVGTPSTTVAALPGSVPNP